MIVEKYSSEQLVGRVVRFITTLKKLHYGRVTSIQYVTGQKVYVVAVNKEGSYHVNPDRILGIMYGRR